MDIYGYLNVFENLENIIKYSLIIHVYTMSEIKEEYIQNICTAVERGVGLTGCHGAMSDSFRNSTKWQFLTGFQWVEHPGNDGIEYEVNIIKSSSSPIVEGTNETWLLWANNLI